MGGQSDWPWDSELARVAAEADPAAVARESARLPMAHLAQLRESWLTAVTSTEPTDPERARAAIDRLYRAGGHDAPERVVLARSPFEGHVLTAIERYATDGRSGPVLRDLQPSARETLAFTIRLGPELAVALWREVAVPLHRALGVTGARFGVPAFPGDDPIARCLQRGSWRRLADAAPPRRFAAGPDGGEPGRTPHAFPAWHYARRHAALFAGLSPEPSRGAVLRYLWRAARPGVARPWWSLTGPRAFADAGYFAWLEAACEMGGELSALAQAQLTAGRECLWAWCLGRAAIVADRPADIDLDALPTLDGPDAPIARFRDGTSAWAWRGRPMPASFFVPGWSVRRALHAEDVEERRCAAERLGWPTFVRRALLRRIGRAPDPANPGADLTLYAPPPWRLDRRRLLLCVNGTPEPDGQRRSYGLWVPRGVSSALQAAAWTYGLEPQQYATAVRRA